MKLRILYSIIAILLIQGYVLADSAPPDDFVKTEKVKFEVEKNYDNYAFYLCTYGTLPVEIRNPQDRYKEGELDPASFQATLINLTVEQPFMKDVDSKRWWLIAVKKELESQLKPELNAKLMSVVKTKNNENGIYGAPVANYSMNYHGSRLVISKIKSLDEKGLILDSRDGEAAELGGGKFSRFCGGMFIFLGITLFGIARLKRKTRLKAS